MTRLKEKDFGTSSGAVLAEEVRDAPETVSGVDVGERDAEFEKHMAMARDIMREDRALLKRLADS